MILSEFILEAVFAVVGAGGLVAALMWREVPRHVAILGLVAAIFAIYVSGQAVLTSGAATLAAILVMAGQWIGAWRQWVYKSFFILFKVIWVGVGFNAAYNIGVAFWDWPGPEILTASWFFAEGLFAIIILTGFYIGKVLGPEIAGLLKTGEPPSTGLFNRIAAAGGASFVSWYAWSMARQGFFENVGLIHLIATWFGGVILVCGLAILLENLRRTINARHSGRA